MHMYVRSYACVHSYMLRDPRLVQVLADHFGDWGPVVAVRLASAVDTLKRKAWIEFATEAAAQAAQGYGDHVRPHQNQSTD